MADYKVAVELTLVGGIAQALALVSRHMLGIHGQTKAIEKGFASWRPALLGVVGVFAAAGIVKELSSIAKGGDEVLNMMARLKMQGQTTQGIKEAFNLAADVTGKGAGRFMTPSAAMGAIKDLAFATGTVEDAMRRLPQVASLTGIMATTLPGTMTPEQSAHQTFSLYKMLEEQNLLGSGREDDAQKVLEGIAKDISITGGKTSPEGYRQTMLMARAAGEGYLRHEALGMAKPFQTHYLPHIMQSLAGGGLGGGGTRGVGPLLNQFYQVAGMGKIGNRHAAMEWNRRGFLEGGLKHHGFGPQNVKEAELAKLHPYEWMQHRVMDLQKQGFNTWDKLSKEISTLFPQKTAAALAQFMAQGGYALGGEKSPFEKTARMFDQAPNFEELTKIAQQSPKGIMAMFHAQERRMQELVGFVTAPARLSVLKEITHLFTAIGDFAKTPQGVNTIRSVSQGLLGLAAALAALGSAAILTAMFSLVGLPGLIIALGAAMAALSPKVGAAVTAFVNAMGDGDTAKMRTAAHQIGQAIMGAMIAGFFEGAMALLYGGPKAVGEALGSAAAGALGGKGMPVLPDLGFKQAPSSSFVDPMTGLPTFGQNSPGNITRDTGVPSLADRLKHTGGGPGPESFPMMPSMPSGMAPYKPPASWHAPQVVPNPNTSPFLPRGGMGGFGGYAPSTGKLLQNQSWEPQGGGGGSIQVHNTIHLDGAAIARAVNEYQTAGLEHPTQAPYFDGRSSYTPPDWQPIYG